MLHWYCNLRTWTFLPALQIPWPISDGLEFKLAGLRGLGKTAACSFRAVQKLCSTAFIRQTAALNGAPTVMMVRFDEVVPVRDIAEGQD